LNCAAGTKFLNKAHQVCLVFASYTHTAIKISRKDGKGHYARNFYGPHLEATGTRLRSQSDIDISIERSSESGAIHLCMETGNHFDLLKAANPLSRCVWAQMNALAEITEAQACISDKCTDDFSVDVIEFKTFLSPLNDPSFYCRFHGAVRQFS
jgi:hypothetical protein